MRRRFTSRIGDRPSKVQSINRITIDRVADRNKIDWFSLPNRKIATRNDFDPAYLHISLPSGTEE
jgi:hypothetical protein